MKVLYFRQNVYLLMYTHVQMHEHTAIATHKSCTSAGTAIVWCVGTDRES